MSDYFAARPLLALGALLLLVGFSVYLDRVNPRNAVKARLGESYFSPDMTPLYKPSRLFGMLGGHYDDADFAAHRRFIWPLDTLYPLVYAACGAVMLLYLQGALGSAWPSWLRLFWLVPVAAACCDLLENFAVWRVLEAYEGRPRGVPLADPPYWWAVLGSAMTTLKLVLFLASGVLLVGVLIAGILLKLLPSQG